MTATILTLLWLPMVSHCRLESIPSLAFLQCVADADSAETSHCDDSGCCSLEDSSYKAGYNRLTLPEFVPAVIIAAFVMPTPPAEQMKMGRLIHPPPDQHIAWQFFARTALPPRAPSSIS
jgi:hypothetical protein